MSGAYNCVHVPVKGARLAVKHPVPAGIAGLFVLIVYANYGIWPFVLFGVLVVITVVGLAYLTQKSTQGSQVSMRTMHMDVPYCISGDGALANTIFRVTLPGGEYREIPVCRAHIEPTENWIKKQELTSR
jgi:uncharacterized membrane protein